VAIVDDAAVQRSLDRGHGAAEPKPIRAPDRAVILQQAVIAEADIDSKRRRSIGVDGDGMAVAAGPDVAVLAAAAGRRHAKQPIRLVRTAKNRMKSW
jgi:hypothetical protein